MFTNTDFRRDLALTPYTYNCIKASDFYSHAFDLISKQKNIHFLNEKVTDINELKTHVYVATETQSFTGDKLFNSIYRKGEAESQNKYPVLQQHFIGWFIKSKEAVFNRASDFYGFLCGTKRQYSFYVCFANINNRSFAGIHLVFT